MTSRSHTLAELRKSGWQSTPVKEEMRRNLLRRLKSKESLFPGIVGYERTVVPAIANAILDQGVHVDNWTKEQAMDLMVRQTFQQEREAEGKWTRVQLTSAQLPTYFVGVQEHFDTRKAVEAKLGDKFNLKAYHDQVLS